MFIAFRLVVKKLVDEELMIIDVDAKMFVVNRLANLFNVVPRLYVLSCAGSISVTVDEPVIDRVPVAITLPPKYAEPCTASG